MQLRWGIVGLGHLAHEGIAPAIRTSTGGRPVACASRSEARAREFAELEAPADGRRESETQGDRA